MDSSTRIFIDNLAEAVIDAYGITIPIDNIEDVVKKIGGEIVEKADLDDLYDGTIRKVDQSSFSKVRGEKLLRLRMNWDICFCIWDLA